MVVLEPVQSAIMQCLNHFCYSDAIFLSERLHAEVCSDESLFLLSSAYMRASQPNQAYHVLKKCSSLSPKCRYIQALACYALDKLFEVETALSGHILALQRSLNEIVSEYGDLASNVLSLLGRVYCETGRPAKATEYYLQSVKLNPYLWSSYEALCKLGDYPDVDQIFQSSSSVSSPNLSASLVSMNSNISLSESISEKSTLSNNSPQVTQSPLMLSSPSFGVLGVTPNNSQNQLHNYIMPPSEIKLERAPVKRALNRRQQAPLSRNVFGNSSSNARTIDISQNTGNSAQPTFVRRSTRLFSHASSSVKENNKAGATKPLSGTKSPVKKSRVRVGGKDSLKEEKRASSSQNLALSHSGRSTADSIMSVLRDIGRAFAALSAYKCQDSLELWKTLPPQHYQTPWVMCQVAKAHFELADYELAATVFGECHKRHPQQVEGMEVYSTALWHLQKEVQLSALAQQLVEVDSRCLQTWCVTGNCFSLQREHEMAIKFFQRAVQLNPKFSYAYTLLGHEYVSTENLDKAMSCFRTAVTIDKRHYNAWYGLGVIYYKQEKYQLAEVHFQRALEINPTSSVLLCHVGVVQHALKRWDAALQTLDHAIASHPKNALCRFHRASILFSTDRHQDALAELEDLKCLVPRESLVYFLIGKVHKKLGNTHLALMNFSWATDLDPKGANNQIKEAIDKRYVTEEEENVGDDSNALLDNIEAFSNNLMDASVHLHANESDESL